MYLCCCGRSWSWNLNWWMNVNNMNVHSFTLWQRHEVCSGPFIAESQLWSLCWKQRVSHVTPASSLSEPDRNIMVFINIILKGGVLWCCCASRENTDWNISCAACRRVGTFRLRLSSCCLPLLCASAWKPAWQDPRARLHPRSQPLDEWQHWDHRCALLRRWPASGNWKQAQVLSLAKCTSGSELSYLNRSSCAYSSTLRSPSDWGHYIS